MTALMSSWTAAARAGVSAVLAIAVLALGCTGGRKPSADDRVLTHEAAYGETMAEIADDYYGDPSRADDIRDFNDYEKGQEPVEGVALRVPMTPEDMRKLAIRREARVPYNRALDLVTRGKYLDAVIDFDAAIETDPSFADAYFNLGVTLQKVKSHEKALEALGKASKLRPGNAAYQYAIGSSHFYLEDYDKAIRAFRRALEADPRHAKAQYSLALSLERDGREVDARAAWQRYLELDNHSDWADRARARLEALSD